MQVSVEKTSELSRKMTVSLPEDMIQEKVEARYKSLAREVKVDGFRPGKVPVRVVKKMYGDRIKGEITGDLIQSTYIQALKDNDLNPAGHPHINTVNESDGFEYTAEFEVYPEVLLEGLAALEIKKPIAVVEQADQDVMVAKLQEQKKGWSVVAKDSENGDRVTVNFSGVCDGENFTDGKVDEYPIEIGANKMIPGFEDEIVGLKAGATKTFDLTFPKDYGNDKLSGKVAEFDVEIIKVEVSKLPEIDEDFIKAYGIEDGTLESFKADVKTNMEKELASGLKEKLKNSVMDALYENIKVAVPKALLDQEIQNMMKPYESKAARENKTLEDLDIPKDMFEDQAKRRVALSLLLGEIIQKNEIKVDDAKVRTTLEEMASSYESPKEVVEWYYSDETRLNEVKQIVMEDMTVEWIINQAKVTEESTNFNDVMDKESK